MGKWIVIGVAVVVGGCTSGDIASIQAYGKPAHVICYSGGRVIYDGYSSGIVQNEHSSDGYYFQDAADGRLKSVSGQCVVDYGG